MWDGQRAGPHAAVEATGVDEAYAMPELEAVFDRLGGRGDGWQAGSVYSTGTLSRLSSFSEVHARAASAVARAGQQKRAQPLEPDLHCLRLRKSQTEVAALRNAAEVSGSAIRTAMRATEPGMNEQQLDALLEFEVRRRGATRLAYPPVVAGGARANTLHYVQNDQVLTAGDLVLVDAGAEYDGYCADITRVWPVAGHFSEPQAAVYTAVLNIQAACLAALDAGEANSFRDLEMMARSVLEVELEKLGLISPAATAATRREVVYKLMPHAIGHNLGMDVHDCSTISTLAQLDPGVALTIEPGIYIPDVDGLPGALRGIGVRIEDNVIMRHGGGIEVLTTDCPKVGVAG